MGKKPPTEAPPPEPQEHGIWTFHTTPRPTRCCQCSTKHDGLWRCQSGRAAYCTDCLATFFRNTAPKNIKPRRSKVYPTRELFEDRQHPLNDPSN